MRSSELIQNSHGQLVKAFSVSLGGVKYVNFLLILWIQCGPEKVKLISYLILTFYFEWCYFHTTLLYFYIISVEISFPSIFCYNTSCYSTFTMSSKKTKESTQLIFSFFFFLDQWTMGIATKVVAETWQCERDGLQLALS